MGGLAQGEGQEKRLVAYVAAEAHEGLINSLREHLSVQLPDYMVPAAFVRLDGFPLRRTVNWIVERYRHRTMKPSPVRFMKRRKEKWKWFWQRFGVNSGD
ncbi:hypothetical protein [Xenorhabdus siamensis]|uniref:hypothetical protein n=1 Tax=Xenorhabdus siamensis TaxID=3136254 RepID=UPI0030F48339